MQEISKYRATQKSGAVSNVIKNLFLILHRNNKLSEAGTVQVSRALPSVRFSCLLLGLWTNFQDGVAAEEGFLCAPF
jgi:hypothetical protein